MESVTLQHYFIALAGAVGTFVWARNKIPKGGYEFIESLAPGYSPQFYNITEFVLVTGLGALMGVFIVMPQSSHQAMIAGVTWMTTFAVLTSKGGHR
jgi:hypothetical protein